MIASLKIDKHHSIMGKKVENSAAFTVAAHNYHKDINRMIQGIQTSRRKKQTNP